METTDAVLDALDALLPEIAERATEAERLRTMPLGLVARAEAAGLFRMQRVRALGGLEVDPPTLVDVVERLAHADASAAWTVLIGATSNALFGWLAPAVARGMLDGTETPRPRAYLRPAAQPYQTGMASSPCADGGGSTAGSSIPRGDRSE